MKKNKIKIIKSKNNKNKSNFIKKINFTAYEYSD
jgi:hypothetical protein